MYSHQDLIDCKSKDPRNSEFWEKLILITETLRDNYGIKKPIFVGPISEEDPKKAKTKIRVQGESHTITIRHFPEYTIFIL